MSKVISVNTVLVEVNNALNDILIAALKSENEGDVEIRFDLPERDTPPAQATISVFLYDVHEDLQLRTTTARHYDKNTGSLSPGWTNVNCNYLITYWDPNKSGNDGGSPDSLPKNQSAVIMSRVISSLINNRQLPALPGAYTRMIQPQENLNSLGTFWQALDNRPRLSLMYSVTVPVSLSNSLNIKQIDDISICVVKC